MFKFERVSFRLICGLILIIWLVTLTGCFGNDDVNDAIEPLPDLPTIDDVQVNTYAGAGIRGDNDGPIREASFSYPAGLVLQEDGTLLVADSQNHLIRAIFPEGQVITLAGTVTGVDEYGLPIGGYRDGSTGSAMFNEPRGMVLSHDGLLYIADSGNGAIRYIDENGQVHTFVDGLDYPTGVVFDQQGNLLVSETLAHRILQINPDGEISILAGGGYEQQGDWLIGDYQDGTGEQAQFNEPTGLAMDANRLLYVVDTANQRIRTVTNEGQVNTLAGYVDQNIPDTPYFVGGYIDGQANTARFNFPQGISIGLDGRIYISDTYNHNIRMIDPDLNVQTLIGFDEHGRQDGDRTAARFDGPVGIIHSGDGLYVSDQWNHTIRRITYEEIAAE